jgi:UDP-3-O-[3-hydroxymyristoyl] glucosamine N-acyltransferase
MPDSRFFENTGPVSLGELARLTGAQLSRADAADRPIRVAGPLTRVGPDAISFYADRRYRDDLVQTSASACFLRSSDAGFAPEGCVLLFTDEPHAAYARAAHRLHPPRMAQAGDPLVHPSAEIEDGVTLGPGVVVGAGAQIGRGTVIGAYTVIGPGVALGRDCAISPQVVIGFSLIGDRVSILAGAMIGEPGFGVTTSGDRTLDVPQLGRVIIQDNVGVGAGTCIDRGAWEDTVIGENTKIDNLVQIAHNVRIGRNCLIAAQTGISGSVVVGDNVSFGGRAGITNHITIGDGATIAGTAGVMKNVPAGEMWVGSPARPIKRFMRETAWVAKMARTRTKGPESE